MKHFADKLFESLDEGVDPKFQSDLENLKRYLLGMVGQFHVSDFAGEFKRMGDDAHACMVMAEKLEKHPGRLLPGDIVGGVQEKVHAAAATYVKLGAEIREVDTLLQKMKANLTKALNRQETIGA